MTEPYFQIRQRFRAARTALRSNPGLQAGSPAFLELSAFFRDLLNDLAAQHPSGRNTGHENVLRCIAEVVGEGQTPPRPPPRAKTRYDVAFPEKRFPMVSARGWKPISALKLFGYTVGAQGWPQQDRQDFLRYFIEAHLPLRVAE